VTPIWCRDSEYTPDGFRTKEGQIAEGVFHGEIFRLIRDEGGHVTDRFIADASTGQLYRHDVVGPFGSTERTIYLVGKITMRQTFSYDQYGHLQDVVSFDGAGNYEGRVFTRRDKTGAIMERSFWGKDGKSRFRRCSGWVYTSTFSCAGAADLICFTRS
jgi:hypothetical protein